MVLQRIGKAELCTWTISNAQEFRRCAGIRGVVAGVSKRNKRKPLPRASRTAALPGFPGQNVSFSHLAWYPVVLDRATYRTGQGLYAMVNPPAALGAHPERSNPNCTVPCDGYICPLIFGANSPWPTRSMHAGVPPCRRPGAPAAWPKFTQTRAQVWTNACPCRARLIESPPMPYVPDLSSLINFTHS